MSTDTQPTTPNPSAPQRMWAIATWSTVILFQAVCGLFLTAMLVLTKLGFRDNDIASGNRKILIAAAAATVITLLLSAPFLTSRRPIPLGIGRGLATSASIFAIGALTYVLWLN